MKSDKQPEGLELLASYQAKWNLAIAQLLVDKRLITFEEFHQAFKRAEAELERRDAEKQGEP